ncbi:MAG: hypothetical protein DYG93_05280 [Leptolyngbya sp. PLA2]|nr:hypothetical protein [Leptolyngbya sp.]MCE7971060.1 hypothetical protein [Leptolyngbya sp. PL-A2]MCZ7631867.1 M12 family metallo-peptidase [Phycisphaerales bacterium]MDL1905369.1 hypothetical protein [Synechococcales cyanobacterium CNB]GIK20328.1 MAG: hypothetical protein BroJett004_24920 [Planctomycetota bacterium]
MSLRTSVLRLSMGLTVLGMTGSVRASDEPVAPGDALQTRAIAVDAGVYSNAVVGGAISLPLFDDLSFGLLVERVDRRADGVTVRGKVAGYEAASFVVTVEHGLVSVGVWTPHGAFGVQPTGVVLPDGRIECVAVEWSPHAVVRCAAAEIGHGTTPQAKHVAGSVRGTEAVEPSGAARQSGEGRSCCSCDDDVSRADVLVIYTTKAKTAAGGAAALQTRVQNVIDTTNLTIANSLVSGLEMAMVGFMEVAYDEVSPDWLDHLIRVTESGDGYMDEVHGWRDAAAADCVLLIVDDTRFLGGAGWWAIWDDGAAFTCLNWRSAGGGILTGAHEFGHNFGCAHDHENDPSAPFSYAWGHYYTHAGTNYGDVMSYPVDVYVPIYSHPGVLGPGGKPMGVPIGETRAAYNAFVVEQTRHTLANYRKSGRMRDCNGNGIDDAIDITDATSSDTNGNGIPDECERRIHVDMHSESQGQGAAWGDALRDLAEVTAAANLRCSHTREVWVADGTYLPDSGQGDPWRRFSLRSGLALYGGFQGQSHPGGGETSIHQRVPGAFESVLSGDIGIPGDDSDNSYALLEALDSDANAVLDGFVVEGGRSFGSGGGMLAVRSSAVVRDCVFRDNRASGSGGASIVIEPCSMRFERCSFEGNAAGYAGGAVSLYDGASALFHECRFEANSGEYAGAIAGYTGVNVAFVGCEFTENTASWGGAAVELYDSATGSFMVCWFEGNEATNGYGGAIAVGWQSEASVALCEFTDNSSGGVGGAISLGDSTLRADANLFRQNVAQTYGGAIDAWNSQITLVSNVLRANTAGVGGGAFAAGGGTQAAVVGCTLHANHAADRGGGMAMSGSHLALTGSILWANTDPNSATQEKQVFLYSGTAAVNRSCVQGWTGSFGGVGNIGADPKFVNAGAGVLLLSAGSPCIDAGDNTAVPADGMDIDEDANTTEAVPVDFSGDPRFHNDMGTTDTGVPGNGHTAVIDMGAFEFQGNSCKADFNNDGVVNTLDFIAFLNAFTSGDQRADFNGDGVINTLDFIAFLNAFTAGCS